MGSIERKYWQGVTFGEGAKKEGQQVAIFQYIAFILKLYGAQPLAGMQHLHGKKGKAVVHIGAVDAPVTIDEINACMCFGKLIDIDKDEIRGHLSRYDLQDGISKYLARAIGKLTAEKKTLEFENPSFKLSETAAFIWRRNLPLFISGRTIFNYVATYNDYEKDFAKFLHRCSDVARFASLGTTEQESGTRFKVDYLKSSGALGFYYPDWVAIQKLDGDEVNWIIETKGREWEDTLAKDAAISEWCRKVSDQVGRRWRYIRVNQSEFLKGNQFSSFESLVETIGPKKKTGLV